MHQPGRLVVVSNRVPAISVPRNEEVRRAQSVGGLVSAVRAALQERGGLWFGWSGSVMERGQASPARVRDLGSFQLATIDLSREEANLFYTFFANRTLWPLLHSMPERTVIRHDAYRAYRRTNHRFATELFPLLKPEDVVWVHDYHLIPLGLYLRRLGWKGRVGFFLHTPFPPPETFSILPWSQQLLEGFLSYDLVGFHTTRYAHNLLDTLVLELGGSITEGTFVRRNQTVRTEVYPIGTDPLDFERWAAEAEQQHRARAMLRIPEAHRIILGVDRLDYTKGIPVRLMAFEYLLEHYPSLRRNITFIQISVPSRTRVPEYIEEKNRVDQLVGSINGRYSEAGWSPVHYLYRAFGQQELAGFYREADVCLVTPLRDGMNLIAKEFVASQDPKDPGVLVLSKFCGAAETMREALIVNPYDIEGTARAIHDALTMRLRERRRRWEALVQEVRKHTAHSWASDFLADLMEMGPPAPAAQPSVAGTLLAGN